jgi:hopanoid biosynthesis associated radical SAM protein HpnH
MGVPLTQQYVVSRYILAQKLWGRRRYPLVLMLEPLFQCNLACAGCGKIDYPDEILNRRLTVSECLAAADECGCPVISIAGGEPFLHREMPEIVRELVKRKRFVYLCTNGLLLEKNMDDYTPSAYLTFSIHLDGNRERHDAMAGREGVFDRVVETVKAACKRGFRVTINCTLYEGMTARDAVEFFDFVGGLGAEGITVAPGFNYERAHDHEVFMKRSSSKQLFRDILKEVNGRKLRFYHTHFYLDFLAGNRTYQCTPWGNPTRNVLGWQRPCYLLSGEGFAPSFRDLMDQTEWEKYGVGINPKCAQCMLHSGFEPTAVEDMFRHPVEALKIRVRGPRTDGPMAPEPPVTHPYQPLRTANQDSQITDKEKEMLRGVSRSFALTIPQLPPPLRSPVTNGYLLCRIADTIEDEEMLSVDQRAFFFQRFIDVMEGKGRASEFADALFPLLSEGTSPAEKELIRNTPWVVQRTFSFSEEQQLALKRCAKTMARGMLRFQHIKGLHGLKDLAELDRYCYYVAGVVGEMLTHLFCDYSEDIRRSKEKLLSLACSFGQGLQMTNILKDLWDDRGRGVCWLPRDIFEKQGWDLSHLSPGAFGRGYGVALAELVGMARRHLENALTYSLIIPPCETGIRKFLLWAIGLAVFTLRNIARHPAYSRGEDVKVSRSRVKAIILLTDMTIRSNYLLKALFRLSAKGLPEV